MADLFSLAETFRDGVGAWYDTNAHPLPTLRQVVPGVPAADCEMLAVQVEVTGPHAGDPVQDFASGTVLGWMRYARLVLWVLRCVPTVDDAGNPPSQTDTEAASLLILRDGDYLWAAVQAMQQAGQLPGCGAVAWQGWRNQEPSGGIGGGSLSVVVDVTGW